MKRSMNILVAALAFVAVTIVAAAASTKVTRHTTPAGHEFSYVPMDGAKRTAVAITWKSGLPTGAGFHEASARLGITLMLKGGAGGLAPDEIAADFEDLDAGSRLWVQPGEIKGFVVAPEENLIRAAEIANLVLTAPNLSERWLEREKKNLIKDTNVRGETASGLAWNLAREIILEGHPYKHFWSVTPTDGVRNINSEQIASWHQNAFGTASLTITAAGSAGPAKVAEAIDLALQGLPNSENRRVLDFAGPDVKPGTIVLYVPNSRKSLIMALGNLPRARPGDSATFNTAASVLGLGKQSRLFKAIRSELRAAYGFGAGTEYITGDHRLLRMGGEVETALLPQALETMRETYEDFRSTGIGEDEFPVARNFYRRRIDEGMNRPAGVASMLMENQLQDWPDQDFEDLSGRIGGLDRSKVNATIKQAYPPYDKLLKIVVTPDANVIEGACVITAIADWRRCF
jgi:predicted Zn-dependent peptidase